MWWAEVKQVVDENLLSSREKINVFNLKNLWTGMWTLSIHFYVIVDICSMGVSDSFSKIKAF